MNTVAGCTGKSSFATWIQAHKRAEKMNRRKSQQGHMTVYRCDRCRAWHIGTSDPQERHVNRQQRRKFFATSPDRE